MHERSRRRFTRDGIPKLRISISTRRQDVRTIGAERDTHDRPFVREWLAIVFAGRGIPKTRHHVVPARDHAPSVRAECGTTHMSIVLQRRAEWLRARDIPEVRRVVIGHGEHACFIRTENSAPHVGRVVENLAAGRFAIAQRAVKHWGGEGIARLVTAGMHEIRDRERPIALRTIQMRKRGANIGIDRAWRFGWQRLVGVRRDGPVAGGGEACDHGDDAWGELAMTHD